MIYRPANASGETVGAVSSRFAQMIIVPPDSVELDDDDVLVIVDHVSGLRAVPVALWRDQRQVAFGGCFCFSEDPRLPLQNGCALPIRIFDQVAGMGS